MTLEFVVLVIAGIQFFIKGFRALKNSHKIRQPKLSTAGEIIGVIGLFIIVGLTRIIGVRGVYDFHAMLIYVLVVLVGILLILVGLQFVIAGYKSEEEIPKWIKWFSKIFK